MVVLLPAAVQGLILLPATVQGLVLLPATVQGLVFELTHVSATYCSHHQGAIML